MKKIQSIRFRAILNSHVNFTNEFSICLDDGSIGIGSSPAGETISIYEGRPQTVSPDLVIETIKADNIFGIPFNQQSFDDYLLSKLDQFGRRNIFALSVAFYIASSGDAFSRYCEKSETRICDLPCLFINILNGGMHAYTNPVASDFHEYLLVPKNNNIKEVIDEYKAIQNEIDSELSGKEKIYVGKNIVNKVGLPSNRKCIELIYDILEKKRLENKYDLMIDAAGTDLWDGHHYRLSITGKPKMTGEELCNYWLGLIKDYKIRYLEDPFHEKDLHNWQYLLSSQDECMMLGDDIHSGNAKRIKQLIQEGAINAVVLKPDQSGTVSETIEAINAANKFGKPVILSHRSISTESIFLPLIARDHKLRYAKFGPLHTDFSSIVKINALIRLLS